MEPFELLLMARREPAAPPAPCLRPRSRRIPGLGERRVSAALDSGGTRAQPARRGEQHPRSSVGCSGKFHQFLPARLPARRRSWSFVPLPPLGAAQPPRAQNAEGASGMVLRLGSGL